MRVLAIEGAAALGGVLADSALVVPDPRAFESHGADTHRVVVDADGAATARCSLWWRATPPHLHHRTGLIGHYAATDARSGQRLLTAACEELARQGCTLAIGPMDGSTWRDYRFVTWRGEAPPFAMEPENPASWPQQFHLAGFATFAAFTSAVTRKRGEPDARLPRARERFARAGVRVRNLHPDSLDEELLRIHRVASISFRESLLYSPIARSDFVEMYRPVQGAIDPDLVFIAESDGRPVGFLFMIPDFRQAARGEAVTTAVLKTVAVLPEKACAGLGTLLVGLSEESAYDAGYRHVIHALMHDTNPSMSISRKRATPMRHYSLFSKDLQQAP